MVVDGLQFAMPEKGDGTVRGCCAEMQWCVAYEQDAATRMRGCGSTMM
jgi:hypothetical protein